VTKEERPPAGFWKRFFNDAADSNLPVLSAAIAYYTTLSLSPLVLLSVVFIGALYPSAQDRFIYEIGALVGHDGQKVIQTIIQNASDKPDLRQAAGWIGAIMLLVTASAVFGQLQTALNRVWRMTDKKIHGIRGFLRRRLFSAGVLLAVLFLTLVSFVAQAMLNLIASSEAIALKAVWWTFSVFLYATLFSMLYRWLPDGRVPWTTAFRGGLITTFMFIVGRSLIGMYLSSSDSAGAYGPAGALIVILLWVYYSAMVFLLAAQILYSVAMHRHWRWAEVGDIGHDARAKKKTGTVRPE
jgi:membrane protein